MSRRKSNATPHTPGNGWHKQIGPLPKIPSTIPECKCVRQLYRREQPATSTTGHLLRHRVVSYHVSTSPEGEQKPKNQVCVRLFCLFLSRLVHATAHTRQKQNAGREHPANNDPHTITHCLHIRRWGRIRHLADFICCLLFDYTFKLFPNVRRARFASNLCTMCPLSSIHFMDVDQTFSSHDAVPEVQPITKSHTHDTHKKKKRFKLSCSTVSCGASPIPFPHPLPLSSVKREIYPTPA